ncbi:hypothetical protein C2845_PM06G17070 [Panicum miliaceum]|uniref:Uncharacterized protein n=1 Tax=Panicum miliaceum TaxID=4540 RepID=A0A3L6R607_PANMI|nr:hypothetical protein C2845_PM06G17070 [Panicum miliaceum]
MKRKLARLSLSPTLHGPDQSLVSYPPVQILEPSRATAGGEATTQLAVAQVDGAAVWDNTDGDMAQDWRRPSPIQRPTSRRLLTTLKRPVLVRDMELVLQRHERLMFLVLGLLIERASI